MKKFLKLVLPVLFIYVAVLVGLVVVFNAKNDKKATYGVESEALALVEKLSKKSFDDGVYLVENVDRSDVSIKPDRGWFVVKSGRVEDFSFYYIDAENDVPEKKKEQLESDFYSNSYVSRVGKKIFYKELKYTTFVDVKDFGATGDGVTNDTKAIREATQKVNENGGILLLPYGKYFVSVDGDEIKNGADKSSVIKITTDKDVIVDFCCSTMMLEGTNYPNNKLVYAYNCTGSVEVKNGTLIGDRKTHNYKAVLNSKGEVSSAQGSYSHCFGHGVGMRNTRNGLIFNMEVYDMTGDALYVKNGLISKETNTEYKTVIEDCVLHHCRRQGITIGDSDLTIVKDTEIYKIGHADEYDNSECLMDEGSVVNAINGSSPMAGIDVEPDSGSFLARLVKLDGVKIHSCTSFGIVGNKSDRVNQGLIDGIEIKNSSIETFAMDYAKIDNSELRVVSEERSKVATLIKKCEITNSKIIKDYPYYEIFYFVENVIKDCVFESVKEDDSTVGIFMFEKNNTVTGCTFKNLRGSGSGTTSYKGYGVTLYLENSFNGDSKNNTFENCDILIRDPHTIKNSTFKNCTISLGYPSIKDASRQNPVYCKFENVIFDNCRTDRYVSDRTAVIMNGCQFYNMKKEEIFSTISVEYVNCNI